jgi:hypothetical protein
MVEPLALSVWAIPTAFRRAGGPWRRACCCSTGGCGGSHDPLGAVYILAGLLFAAVAVLSAR